MTNQFQKLHTTKKGNIGEAIVKEYLKSKGFSFMAPDPCCPHPLDLIAFDKSKGNLTGVEIKTKPSRVYYPDTGFDANDVEFYQHIAEVHNLPIAIFFVDEVRKQVYYGSLESLMEPTTIDHEGRKLNYPRDEGDIIYFPIERMETLCTLTDDQVKDIQQVSHSNYSEKYETNEF